MFRRTEGLSRSNASARPARHYLMRALLFGAGLVLLWVAVELFPGAPTPQAPASTHVEVPAADAAAPAGAERLATGRGLRVFTTGNVIVVLLLAGGGLLAIYLRRRSGAAGSVDAPIKSVGELSLGQSQQLRLVACGGEVLLIGATDQQITLLKTYAAADVLPPPTAEAAPSSEAADTMPAAAPEPLSSHFADILRQYAGRYVNIQQTGTANS